MSTPPAPARRRFLFVATAVGAGALGIGASYWARRDPLQQRPYPPQTVGEHERCPVCGMYPARFPRWKAQIVLSDRQALSFDSLIEVFRYQEKTPGLNIADLYVSDYGDPHRDSPHLWLTANAAFFVSGSTLKGPMGDPALPAFPTHDAAHKLAQALGGKILAYADLTSERKQELVQRQH